MVAKIERRARLVIRCMIVGVFLVEARDLVYVMSLK